MRRIYAEAVTAMGFYKDSLIVATGNNRIYSYNAKTGKQEGVIESNEALSQSYWKLFDLGGDDLVIDNGLGTLYMTDSGNWALTGKAYKTVGFCPELGRVISTNDSSGKMFGYCPYYSLKDLVEKGKIFVGDQTMSETDKAVYGVE